MLDRLLNSKWFLNGILCLCLTIILVFYGCGTMPVKAPPIPEGCEDSLWYKHYGEFKVGSLLIKGGISEFVAAYPEHQEEVISGLKEIERLLKSPAATYAMLGTAILNDIEWLAEKAGGKRIVLAGEMVSLFVESDLTINQLCDAPAFLSEARQLIWYAGG